MGLVPVPGTGDAHVQRLARGAASGVAAQVLLGLLAFVLVTMPAGAGPPASPPDSNAASSWRMSRIDSAYPGAAPRMRVRNPIGNVHLVPADSGTLAVHAVLQWRNGGTAPRLEHAIRRGVHELHVIGRQGRARMDLAIQVPAGRTVEVETGAGNISAGGIGGPLELRTGSGSIQVTARNRIVLRSDSGAIRATVASARWPGQASVRTRSGRIAVSLPGETDLEYRVRSCGPVRIDPAAGSPASARCGWHRDRIGSGRQRLVLESASGEVTLRRVGLEAAPPAETD